MKLLSLNIALFEPNTPQLIEFLTQQNPDILCLQEVVHALEPSVFKEYVTKQPIDQHMTHMPYSFYGPTYVLRSFDKKSFHGKDSTEFDLGGLVEMGNHVRSKYKIVKGTNIFVENYYTYITDFSGWPEEDYRSFLVIDLDVDGKPLTILNYHGIWTRNKLGSEKTTKACQKIYEWALQAKGEVIICGDFNLFPDTPSMKIFENSFTSLVDVYNIKKTRPDSNELSGLSRNVVDYIWVSKGINVKDFQVLDADVSDHLPLVLEFDL